MMQELVHEHFWIYIIPGTVAVGGGRCAVGVIGDLYTAPRAIGVL